MFTISHLLFQMLTIKPTSPIKWTHEFTCRGPTSRWKQLFCYQKLIAIPVGLWEPQSRSSSWRWSRHCDSQWIPNKSHLWRGCQDPQEQLNVRARTGPWGGRALQAARGTCGWMRAFLQCGGMCWQRGGGLAEAGLERVASTSCCVTLALCDRACFTQTFSHY